MAIFKNNIQPSMKVTPAHNERIAKLKFGSVYPLYATKVEKKGRTKKELHEVISWLTSFSDSQIEELIKMEVTFKEFFKKPILIRKRISSKESSVDIV